MGLLTGQAVFEYNMTKGEKQEDICPYRQLLFWACVLEAHIHTV